MNLFPPFELISLSILNPFIMIAYDGSFSFLIFISPVNTFYQISFQALCIINLSVNPCVLSTRGHMFGFSWVRWLQSCGFFYFYFFSDPISDIILNLWFYLHVLPYYYQCGYCDLNFRKPLMPMVTWYKYVDLTMIW